MPRRSCWRVWCVSRDFRLNSLLPCCYKVINFFLWIVPMVHIAVTLTEYMAAIRLFQHHRLLPNIAPGTEDDSPPSTPLWPSVCHQLSTHSGLPRIEPRRINAKSNKMRVQMAEQTGGKPRHWEVHARCSCTGRRGTSWTANHLTQRNAGSTASKICITIEKRWLKVLE